MAHGEPGSCGPGLRVLFGPLRLVTPIGWIGGRYTTSKPIAATPSSRRVAVRKLPDFHRPSLRCFAPSERGKNSYHEPTPARRRSTRIVCSGESVVRRASGWPTNSASSGSSTRARRSAADVAGSRSAVASAVSFVRVARARVFSATARSMSRAPISYISSTSTPASILSAASCRHVAISSSNPVTCQCHSPTSSSSTFACHRSVPGAMGDMRSRRSTPDGLVITSIAPTWSCPSRNTVARNGTTSPSKALGRQRSSGRAGVSRVTGMRPASTGAVVTVRP